MRASFIIPSDVLATALGDAVKLKFYKLTDERFSENTPVN